MAELVTPAHHRLDRPAKRGGRVLRLCAVGLEQVACILGFTNRPNRRSPGAPLQLKTVDDG
jgi:hypothetical protein